MANKPVFGLGKGLSSLIQDNTTYVNNKPEEVVNTGNIALISLDKIVPNPGQPRKDFDPNYIKELSESIKTYGIIQPLTLRKKDDKYEIISGECRYRASQMAELKEVPAYIREADDSMTLQMALVENTHRENLNSIEIALTYNRLIEECHLTQEELSKNLGKGRSTIANTLRLLRLPDQMQAALRNKVVTEGQIRPLISVDDQELQMNLFQKVLNYGLTARQVEQLVQDPDGYVFELERKDDGSSDANPDDEGKKVIVKAVRPKLSDEQKELKKNFSKKFSVPVDLKLDSKGACKLTFNLKSQDDYDKIIQLLNNIQL